MIAFTIGFIIFDLLDTASTTTVGHKKIYPSRYLGPPFPRYYRELRPNQKFLEVAKSTAHYQKERIRGSFISTSVQIELKDQVLRVKEYQLCLS